MVAVSSPAKVLVTGANGYLAVWVVKKYLEAGYSIRGTVRSLSKSTFLTEKFSNYGDRVDFWENGEAQKIFGMTMEGTSQAAAIRTGKIVRQMNSCAWAGQ